MFVKSHYPVKRRQAMLGSNLSSDSRVQVALNNAPGGNSANAVLFPPPRFYYSSLPAHALKNPIKWPREALPVVYHVMHVGKLEKQWNGRSECLRGGRL